MGRLKQGKKFVGDFETTVYEGQTFTEVWASAIVEVGSENVLVFNSLEATYEWIKSQKTDMIIYYHNLKFDGSFWLSWLFSHGYKNAVDLIYSQNGIFVWKKDKELLNNEVKYAISDRGAWYRILFKIGKHYIELRDSYKLLPFSVKRIGESFKTKHQKLDIEYEGYRYAGCTITPEEESYIKNDVLVVSEALQMMFSEGHNKLTIGSCCLTEFKKAYLPGSAGTLSIHDYNERFPNLFKEKLKSRWDILPYDEHTRIDR